MERTEEEKEKERRTTAREGEKPAKRMSRTQLDSSVFQFTASIQRTKPCKAFH